jgi:hypothetical protein
MVFYKQVLEFHCPSNFFMPDISASKSLVPVEEEDARPLDEVVLVRVLGHAVQQDLHQPLVVKQHVLERPCCLPRTRNF